MDKKPYVTYGDGGCCSSCPCGKGDITGCRFSLYPMTDSFISVILGAISEVRTDKVWKETDALSTVYRGKQIHVEDAVRACFIRSYREGVHMAIEMTFSKGCPGDIESEATMEVDDKLLNADAINGIHFPVKAKFSLYPMGTDEYMRHIAAVVNHAIDVGVYSKSEHYCTVLEGDVWDIFDYFHYVNSYSGENLKHYVMEATVNANSPTKE